MTRPGIEPRSPGPMANTLTARPMSGSKYTTCNSLEISFNCTSWQQFPFLYTFYLINGQISFTLIEFNGMPTWLGLFNTERVENCIHRGYFLKVLLLVSSISISLSTSSLSHTDSMVFFTLSLSLSLSLSLTIHPYRLSRLADPLHGIKADEYKFFAGRPTRVCQRVGRCASYFWFVLLEWYGWWRLSGRTVSVLFGKHLAF